MAEKRDRRPRNEDREIEDDVRDISEESDEEFEDVDNEEDDEDLDEDVVDEEASGHDRHFTAEVGSEGGSAGELEQHRAQSVISRGSERTTTGRPSADAWLSHNRRDRR